MLKDILIEAKRKAEQDLNNEIAIATNKLKTNTIAPFHAEIDKKKNDAIAKEREAYNQQIVELQQRFEARKKEYETAAEEKKKTFLETTIATSTAHITAKYSNTIKELDRMIAENGE